MTSSHIEPSFLIYNPFICYLQFLEKKGFTLEEQKTLEKHHIMPLHDDGSKKGPVVLCTAKNHTLAHFYRFLTWQQLGDQICFQPLPFATY